MQPRLLVNPGVQAGAGEPVASKAVAFEIQVGRMARDLSALYKVSSAINTHRNCEQLKLELLRLIFEVIPARAGAVVLASEDDEMMVVSTFDRELGEGHALDLDRDLIQRVIWERAALMSGMEGTGREGTGPGGSATEHLLCAPLIGVEKVIGVLYLAATGDGSPFQDDHVHFLNSVGHIAAVTLENILALDALHAENLTLKQELGPAGKMVGESAAMARVGDFISRVAPSDSNVLIRGESGTGKEVVANLIHLSSGRGTRPFVAINCASIPESLLESELFGHEKGAFTGAVAIRKGKFEAADDGTLFLDEIGELAMPMQAKLLRVLQQREFERVGANRSIPLRARVLTATNKNLEEAIKSGEFRQDLYYRLNVVSVTVPPLREHRSDIPLLALYFGSRFARRGKRAFRGISREAREMMMRYDWPGNVRELENAMEHASVLGMTDEILPEDLPINLFKQQAAVLNGGALFQTAIEEKKKELIAGALREADGNIPAAARLLGLHPKYLHRLARSFDLKPAVR